MGAYDFEPKGGNSLFLQLKEKGETVVIRLASDPYREPKVWKEGVKAPLKPEETARLTEKQWFKIMGDPDYNVSEVYHWIVIDRADGQAKIFSATPGVYKSIKEYALNVKWGNPTQYDLEITRTEQPGRGYYKVTPDPDKTPLTNKEQSMVDKIDINEKVQNARLTTEVQLDDISEYEKTMANATPEDDEPAQPKVGNSGYETFKANVDRRRAEAEAKKPPKEDVVIEDFDDAEPIDLSEIPF